MHIKLFLLILISSLSSYASNKAAAGLELGGNGTFMFSDPSVQIFAGGAGLQGSAYFSMWNERPIGGKLRYELVSLQEGALQKSNTSYLIPGTSLKSMTQSWNMISAGVEGHTTFQNQTVFWEALLGYAISNGGSVNVTPSTQDQPVYGQNHAVSNAIVLTGGGGIKRTFTDRLIGIVSLRTFFILAPIYSTDALNQKTLIAFPIMFNIGIETPFEI